MHYPPRLLISPGNQGIVLGLIAVALTLGGFQAGRRSVEATALARTIAPESSQTFRDIAPPGQALLKHDQNLITVREIASVPFSELYDVLKSAPREQLLAWAADLEQMPRGPRRIAAVTAYYKSLVQVDHRTAIEAVLRAQNLDTRDFAIGAITKAAPESVWGDLAEMMVRLPFPNRGFLVEDVVSNWSAVDPAAAAEFIAAHPVEDKDDRRLTSLLWNWGRIDPVAARDWLEADPSRQTKGAFGFFVSAWAATDRPAAIQYVLANVSRPNFDDAINQLAYEFVRIEKDQATSLMLLLPPENAKGALKHIARETTGVFLGLPADYQRPPEEVARWMVTLPMDLWREAIGEVAHAWLTDNATAATRWLNQLQPDLRDGAIVSLCRSAEADSLEQVLTLGASITDRKMRDSALGQFARNLGDSREDAIDAVNELHISEEQKAYLLEVMPENKDRVR